MQPTTKNFQAVLGDFHNISLTRRYTSGDINSFLKNDFVKEGQEIKAAFTTPSDFNASPSFLNNISSPTAKAFAQVVHGFWPQLIRTTNPSALCTDPNKCESTFIPLNNPFVVNGSCFDYLSTVTKTKLTIIISWNFQRTILLGHFLYCRRSSSIPTILGREEYSSKFYGSTGSIWFYSNGRPYLLCALSFTTISILLFNLG